MTRFLSIISSLFDNLLDTCLVHVSNILEMWIDFRYEFTHSRSLTEELFEFLENFSYLCVIFCQRTFLQLLQDLRKSAARIANLSWWFSANEGKSTDRKSQIIRFFFELSKCLVLRKSSLSLLRIKSFAHFGCVPLEKSCLKFSWLIISLLELINSLGAIKLGRCVRDWGKWSSTKYCDGKENPFSISSFSIEFLNLKIMLAKYLCEVILKIPKK